MIDLIILRRRRNVRFSNFTKQYVRTLAIIQQRKGPAMLFWVLITCRLVRRYRRFGEIYCLHLQVDAGKCIGPEEERAKGECAESQNRLLSPEDEDSIFLRNVGIYL
jgi:hypothetical protein